MKIPDPIFVGDVKLGRLHFRDPERFKRWVGKLDGSKVHVTVKKAYKRRSNQQNRWYWGCIIEILRDHFGYTPEEMHEALKMKFLLLKHAKLPTVRSTAAMTSAEFSDYIEDVRRWAATEFDLQIPDPDQVDI